MSFLLYARLLNKLALPKCDDGTIFYCCLKAKSAEKSKENPLRNYDSHKLPSESVR